MNETKIEWCDMSWNPVTGCLHGCEYCYARRIAKRFGGYTVGGGYTRHEPFSGETCVLDEPLLIVRENDKVYKAPYPYDFLPTFHRYRLDEPQKVKKPSKIFVCSMSDLFGEWVPDEWIQEVFKACEAAPWHTYLFLTKNYKKASRFRYRNNWWIGKTITNSENSMLFEGDPWSIDGIHRANHFLSVEPLQGDIDDLKYYLYSFKWVIIGAETGNRKAKVSPQKEWIVNIVKECEKNDVPVFMKNSLKPIWGKDIITEYPW